MNLRAYVVQNYDQDNRVYYSVEIDGYITNSGDPVKDKITAELVAQLVNQALDDCEE